MRIEDHWYDGIEYYIEFETTCERVIRKTIIFPTQLTNQEIEEIVMKRFMAVKKVVGITEIKDILIPKSEIVVVGASLVK